MAMTINSMANNQLSKVMTKIATGNRINSAADDAAGLAIAEKMKSIATGYDVGTSNAQQMGNLLNTAEGALSNVSDMLGRMRELGLQASNGLMTSGDKKAIQNEISQIKEEIERTANSTEYNTMNLLDGTFAGKNLASNPDGSGMEISVESSALEALGIADFDVTRSFNLSDLDNAISKVSENRSSIGSMTNAIDHVVNANKNAYINQIASLSQIESQDIAAASSELNKQKAISQLQMFNTQKQNDNMRNIYSLLT